MKSENDRVGEVIIEILGKQGEGLLELLRKKSNVSEFKIAEKIKVTINETRNLLYKLVNHNLVSFTRKKDKKKGWYIYYWTLNVKEVENLAIKLKKEKIDKLKKRLEKESAGYFLSCPNKCIRLSLESAMDYNFKCPECGSVLAQEKEGHIERVKREIIELEDEIRDYEIKKREDKAEEEKKAVKVKKKAKKKLNKKKVKKKRLRIKVKKKR